LSAGHRKLLPAFWRTHLAGRLAWASGRLPYPVQIVLGGLIGRFLYLSMGERREVAWANLSVCFPELSRAQRAQLLRRHFGALGIAVMEVGAAWWGSDEALARRARIRGMEHLDAALAAGHGVILLGAHFTTLEIGLRVLTARRPCHVVYRPLGDQGLEQQIRAWRARHRVTMVPREDVRGMIRALRENQPLWMAPDQNTASRHAVFVPFFGEPAATVPTLSKLCRRSHARVVPFVQHRLPGLAGYELVLGPALEDFPSGDSVADTARINQVIEVAVRRSPEQYLWTHRRFKTRPPGRPPLYPP